MNTEKWSLVQGIGSHVVRLGGWGYAAGTPRTLPKGNGTNGNQQQRGIFKTLKQASSSQHDTAALRLFYGGYATEITVGLLGQSCQSVGRQPASNTLLSCTQDTRARGFMYPYVPQNSSSGYGCFPLVSICSLQNLQAVVPPHVTPATSRLFYRSRSESAGPARAPQGPRRTKTCTSTDRSFSPAAAAAAVVDAADGGGGGGGVASASPILASAMWQQQQWTRP